MNKSVKSLTSYDSLWKIISFIDIKRGNSCSITQVIMCRANKYTGIRNYHIWKGIIREEQEAYPCPGLKKKSSGREREGEGEGGRNCLHLCSCGWLSACLRWSIRGSGCDSTVPIHHVINIAIYSITINNNKTLIIFES